MNQLQNCNQSMSPVSYDLTTFLGSAKKVFNEAVLDVHIPGFRMIQLPVLADADFNINFHVTSFDLGTFDAS